MNNLLLWQVPDSETNSVAIIATGYQLNLQCLVDDLEQQKLIDRHKKWILLQQIGDPHPSGKSAIRFSIHHDDIAQLRLQYTIHGTEKIINLDL